MGSLSEFFGLWPPTDLADISYQLAGAWCRDPDRIAILYRFAFWCTLDAGAAERILETHVRVGEPDQACVDAVRSVYRMSSDLRYRSNRPSAAKADHDADMAQRVVCLPREMRLALYLRFGARLPIGDVATVLEISEGVCAWIIGSGRLLVIAPDTA